MKIEHITLFFLTIISSLYLFLFVDSNINLFYSQHQQLFTKYLTLATEDAMSGAIIGKDNKYFSTEQQQKAALNCFYKTFELNCGFLYNNAPEQLAYHIPFVALIDDDGMYVYYKETFEDSSGLNNRTSTLTPLYTWSRNFSNYNVRFYLSDKVTITQIDSAQKWTGPYHSLYKRLDTPASLSFMDNPTDFLSTKNDVIVNEINEHLEHYMNYCNYENKVDAGYTITLPKADNVSWARMIDTPGVFSFFQGMQFPYQRNSLNTYAFSGAELVKEQLYYVCPYADGLSFYHTASCINRTDFYTYYGAMEDCAKKGAYPCSDCVR